MANENSSLVSDIYHSRNNLIDIMDERRFNIEDYNDFSITEVNAMNKNEQLFILEFRIFYMIALQLLFIISIWMQKSGISQLCSKMSKFAENPFSPTSPYGTCSRKKCRKKLQKSAKFPWNPELLQLFMPNE